MRLVWQSDCARAQVWQGDARALDSIGRTFGAVITDPPYSSGGLYRADRAPSPDRKYCAGVAFGGDNKDQWSHTTWSAAWMGAALSLCAPSAPLAVFTDWRQVATQITAAQWGGWVYRGLGAWHKPSGRPNNSGGWSRAPELVVLSTNGPGAHSGDFVDALHIADALPASRRRHLAQKPGSVADWLAALAPRDAVVLDPFVGSGALLAGCLRRGQSVVGVDLDAAHCETAARTLAQALSRVAPHGNSHQIDLLGGAP